MAQCIQFDRFQPGEHPECQASEALLADAVDQVLSPADQAWFEQHIAGCEHCSALFADAQRGAAWLEMLKLPRPEPSANLLRNVLALTSDRNAIAIESPIEAVPASNLAPLGSPVPYEIPAQQPWLAPLLPFRPRPQSAPAWIPSFTRFAFEPRLAMTAAMAFFSIALTLNLTGVRLDHLHVADLKPSTLKRTFYEAKGDAARRYDSVRVVHVLESRVDDLKAAGAGIEFNPGSSDPASSDPASSKPASNEPASSEPKQDPAPRKEQQQQPMQQEQPAKEQPQSTGQPQASQQPESSTAPGREALLLPASKGFVPAVEAFEEKRGRA